MLNKFSDFLLLESVINKDVKTLTEVIYNEFHSKEKEFEEKGILILENFLENNVKELIFFNDKIIFQDSDYPNSGFKCDKVKNKIIFSLTLVIECQKNYTEFSLKESITHELTHMIEYYHSKNEERQSNLKRVEYDDWEKYKKLREHQSKFKNFKEYIDKITYLFYETLGFEMRSRAAQTYQYLKSLNTYNVDILTNELKNSMEWKKMNSIIKINPYKFLETIKLVVQ